MEIAHLAQELKQVVKDCPCVDISDIEESYMGLTDIKGVANTLLDVMEEKYYDGLNDEADFYLQKVNEVNEIMRKYIGAYAL